VLGLKGKESMIGYLIATTAIASASDRWRPVVVREENRVRARAARSIGLTVLVSCWRNPRRSSARI